MVFATILVKLISMKKFTIFMYEDILRDIGLSTNEARVYEAMLETGEANVQTISLKSKVHRRNVYDSLSKLIEKGLVSGAFVRGEKNFRPISPSRLLDIIKEKEEKISSIMPSLFTKYNFTESDTDAQMYRGIEGFKTYLSDILKTKKTVYFIGAKAFWLDPRLKHFLPHFEKERKKVGIKFKHIFDYEVKEKKPEILKLVGKPYKFLPKKYSSPTAIDIFGDYVVTFVGVKPGQLYEEPLQFVIKNRILANGYRKFFDFMWDNLEK